jgi:bacillithiol system protein YtxJ
MKWVLLTSEAQFNNLLLNEKQFAVFKHSTRCSISSVAKNRLERDCDDSTEVYYLDLLAFRSLSNHIAHVSGVPHESPQLIVFRDGKSVGNASHFEISADFLKELA